MNINVIDINDSNLQEDFMKTRGTQWKINQPNASHMGGKAYWSYVRILDGLLLDAKVPRLTHEVLVTLIVEVCYIVNTR